MISSLTIAEANRKLRAKEIGSTELVKACIERIEKIDAKLNAVIYRNFEFALKEANAVDKRGVFDEPLAGIPYLTKDDILACLSFAAKRERLMLAVQP